MSNSDFCDAMRMANAKQKDLLLHIIHKLLSDDKTPLQIFFTGPAGCGKTFTIKLIMDIYNRFSDSDGFCNAYIACASTGNAAIGGTTVHTALKISLSKLLPLSIEIAHQYRALFKYVRVIIIDEASMISAEMLQQIDQRLKQITGDFINNFGGLDIILLGDLRQLPPVRATPIFKQIKRSIAGPTLWRGLQFYELTDVMRQADILFSNALTKIGNGEKLSNDELSLIESRFFTIEEAQRLCPNGVRLFYSNASVQNYNNLVLNKEETKTTSVATDIYIGCHDSEQENFVRQQLHKKLLVDTGGLPYEIILVLNKYYILTTNIDVSDGLANGSVGKLCHIERDPEGNICRVWLIFSKSGKIGQKIRKKTCAYATQHGIDVHAVPIARRTCTIPLNNNKTINAKRNHFPLVSACAITIHKSQGGSFDEIVYEYEKGHPQQLVYVALSRVTTILGLFIITKDNKDHKFVHGRKNSASANILELQNEFTRLSLNRLRTIGSTLLDFITRRKGLSVYSLNCQSLRAHALDLNDCVLKHSNILMLSETHMTNEEQDIDLPNFNCIVKYKRPTFPAAGVAIYQNTADSTNIVSNFMDIHLRNTETYGFSKSEIGEICIAQCVTEDRMEILLVAIYISPKKSVKEVISFLHRNLLMYTKGGSELLGLMLHEMPMILSGDFNINFASPTESVTLVDFLKEKLNLTMSNDPTQSTTRHGTTIDAVFTRFLDKFESRTFISYFSYHEPIISFLESSDDCNNDNINVNG